MNDDNNNTNTCLNNLLSVCLCTKGILTRGIFKHISENIQLLELLYEKYSVIITVNPAIEELLENKDIFLNSLANALRLDRKNIDIRINRQWVGAKRIEKQYFKLSRNTNILSDVLYVCNYSGGGIFKLIAENHMLAELIETKFPEVLQIDQSPWVLTWLAKKDVFLNDVANALQLKPGSHQLNQRRWFTEDNIEEFYMKFADQQAHQE